MIQTLPRGSRVSQMLEAEEPSRLICIPGAFNSIRRDVIGRAERGARRDVTWLERGLT